MYQDLKEWPLRWHDEQLTRARVFAVWTMGNRPILRSGVNEIV
jgi:hypothetical protein